jgi:hypothetical protein
VVVKGGWGVDNEVAAEVTDSEGEESRERLLVATTREKAKEGKEGLRGL